jgi:hypothetical protein
MITSRDEAVDELQLVLQDAGLIAMRLQDIQNWVNHVASELTDPQLSPSIAAPFKGCSLDCDQAMMYRNHLVESLNTIAAQLEAMK